MKFWRLLTQTSQPIEQLPSVEHPFRKLGLLPRDESLHPKGVLKFGDIRRTGSTVVNYPLSSDHLTGVTYGLYNNDKWGICGPTSIANMRRMLQAAIDSTIPIPSQDDANALYSASTSPPFNPKTGANDNGVELQTMLDQVIKVGIGGKKALAFASVDITNDEEMDEAIAIFGGLIWGVDLEVSQQAQTDATPPIWDYKKSGEWGGHAILAGQYSQPSGELGSGTADKDGLITWALQVAATDSFRRKQLQEAYVVIWEENLGTKQFIDGVDETSLAIEFKRLTGKTFNPPKPSPVTPPVTPTGGNEVLQFLDPVVAARVVKSTPANGFSNSRVNAILRSYFKIKS